MKLEVYNVLIEIMGEFRQDRNDIEEKLQSNLCLIKEAEAYEKAFLNSEPEEDVKVFLPKNNELSHKNEIKDIEERKARYQEENKSLLEKKNILSSRIAQIEKILESEKDDLTILNIQEEDRKRIARDLHDSSLQNLAHLIHQIELSGLYIDEDPIRAKLELSVVNKRLREIIEEIRNTIFDLRPMTFDDLGFKAAIERLIESVNEDKKYEIELDLDNVSCDTNLILVTIYRVVQECLNNIVKHADATKIILSCKCRNNVCHINVSDNGRGFASSVNKGEKHFGIFSMKERIRLLGGDIDFKSVPDEGTTISISIPLVC